MSNFTVEKRPGKSHGLVPPHPEGSPEFLAEARDTYEIAQITKAMKVPTVESVMRDLHAESLMRREEFWPEEIVKLLNKYSPFLSDKINAVKDEDVIDLLAGMGWYSWRDLVDFVRDDECVEFYTRVSKYLRTRGYEERKDRDFIDGFGVGQYIRFTDRLKRSMEKIFDEKNLHDRLRPSQSLGAKLGFEPRCFEIYPHPDHGEYPTGHAGKMFEGAEAAADGWDIHLYLEYTIWKAAWWVSASRTGSPVHYIGSNGASLSLTTRKVASKYDKDRVDKNFVKGK